MSDHCSQAVFTSLLLAFAGLTGFSPMAGAHTQDCAAGNSGIGSQSCTIWCDVGQKWRVTMDAINAFGGVRASVTCGGSSASCGYGIIVYDKCSANMTSTTGHAHDGYCYGEQYSGNLNGFSVQCTMFSGTWTGPAPACETPVCLPEVLSFYERRVVAGSLDAPVSELRILHVGGAAFGYACAGSTERCIRVPALCAFDGGRQACGI